MARGRDWITVTLKFSKGEHRKLKEMKDAQKETWEEFVLSLAGIEE